MSNLNVSVLGSAKEMYIKQLKIVLTPLIHEGFISLWEDSVNKENEHGTYEYIKCFQKFLKEIPKWNQSILEEETKRILKNVDFLMGLVAAIFISHVKILASVRLGGNGQEIKIKIPKPEVFIHLVYTTAAEIFYYKPTIFKDHMKRDNYEEIKLTIEKSIDDTINFLIPIGKLLKQYISSAFLNHVDEKNTKKIYDPSKDDYEYENYNFNKNTNDNDDDESSYESETDTIESERKGSNTFGSNTFGSNTFGSSDFNAGSNGDFNVGGSSNFKIGNNDTTISDDLFKSDTSANFGSDDLFKSDTSTNFGSDDLFKSSNVGSDDLFKADTGSDNMFKSDTDDMFKSGSNENFGSGDLFKSDSGSDDLFKSDSGSGDLFKSESGSGDLFKSDSGSGDLFKSDSGSGDLFKNDTNDINGSNTGDLFKSDLSGNFGSDDIFGGSKEIDNKNNDIGGGDKIVDFKSADELFP
jgi:hypothetical protein